VPKQVWQADDGRVFDSEEACLKHENQDKLLRPLFMDDKSRTKKVVSDHDALHAELIDIWIELGEPEYLAGNIADVLMCFFASSRCKNLGYLQSWSSALKVLGSYLERQADIDVVE